MMMPFLQCIDAPEIVSGYGRYYRIQMLQKWSVLHQSEHMTYTFCFDFLFQSQHGWFQNTRLSVPVCSVLIINLEPVFLLVTNPTCVCFTVLTLPDVELYIKS